MKKILCGLLIGASAVSQAGAFTGVSSWAQPAVNQAMVMGIVPDSLQNTQASKAISRAEFCEVAVELYQSMSGKTAPSNIISPFTDTDNEVIAAASALGIVSGRGDGTFAPYDTITRQEFCVMLCNVTRAIEGKSDTVETNIVDDFKDGDEVADWAKQDVETIVNHNIMTGVLENGQTLLKPLSTTSREQAMVMAVRFNDFYAEEESENQVNQTEQDNEQDNEDNQQNTEQDNEQNTEQDGEQGTYIIKPEEAASLTKDERLMILFGKTEIGFASQQEAESKMVEITVPVWRLQPDGTKKEGKMTLEVNECLSLVYQAIFEEIFNGSEKFPIKDGGSYAWRSNTRSEHRWGTAVDLNWNENMECYIDEAGNVTQITTGSHWLPNEDPYSIPAGGDVVNAFAKYGFAWGGDAWKTKRDYMHFSYFGT